MKEEIRVFLEDYKKEVNQEAKRLLPIPMPELTEEQFALFERTGNRLVYEAVYFARREQLTVTGLEAVLEKRQRGRVEEGIRRKLVQVIEGICKEECWALPAHVNRDNPNWRLTVDLFAAETAQTLSELADRLGDELPENIYGLIVENVERRVLLPFLDADAPFWWEKSGSNWNAVCTGSIGSACLHLMRDREEVMEPCLKRVCEALPHYIAGFAEDGACMEGLGYFTYGMSYFVNFALELREYTHGRTDLLRGEWAGFQAREEDKRARIADFFGKCFFDDGRTVSFSDGSDSDKYHMGLSCALKMDFPHVRIPGIGRAADLSEDSCYRFVFRRMDLLETERYLECFSEDCPGWEEGRVRRRDTPAGVCHVLGDAQWCIANSENGVGFACKGGHNGEPHNHNDAGHFIYESQGDVFFADLGAGEYTRDYFGQGRYDILCNNSFGHSVPVINGCGQRQGEAYGCGRFGVEESHDACVVSMDLAGAYGEGLLEGFSRELTFSLTDGSLCVRDAFTLPDTAGGTVMENLVTRLPPAFLEGRIVLSGEKAESTLYIEGILPERDVTVKEYIHRNHQGMPEKVYAIQWPVALTGGSGRSVYRINHIPAADRQ